MILTAESSPCATGRRWRIGSVEFECLPRAESGPGSRGRWGASNGSVGVGGHRTPVGALLALRRWAREAVALPPCPDGDDLGE
jgi:hypothetical protein